MIVLDAAGLALFAVAGTQKALIYKMHPFIHSARDHYRSGWRHDSRYVPGPRTQCPARRCLCHRSHGRIGGDDPRPKGGTAPYAGRHHRRCRLFWAAPGERLAALESAESCGIDEATPLQRLVAMMKLG